MQITPGTFFEKNANYREITRMIKLAQNCCNFPCNACPCLLWN